MANILGSVAITGFVAPSSETDVYPAHTEEWGRGGFRSVADLTERDAITDERRKEGMLVNVLSTSTLYQLVAGITNLDWQIFSAGASGETVGELEGGFSDTNYSVADIIIESGGA